MDIQVIKIGSDGWWDGKGNLRYELMRQKAYEISDLAANEDMFTALVVSGAVKVEKIRRDDKRKIEDIPVEDLVDYATIGQIQLIKAVEETFREIYSVGQHLFTYDEIDSIRKRRGINNNLRRQMQNCVMPAINYSDSVDFDEIRKDNDQFAAHIAEMIGAKRLIILGSYDGLYKDKDDKATLIQRVEKVTDEFYGYCDSTSCNGVGGFSTKLDAARFSTEHGIEVIIGNLERNICDLASGKVKRTYFSPQHL